MTLHRSILWRCAQRLMGRPASAEAQGPITRRRATNILLTHFRQFDRGSPTVIRAESRCWPTRNRPRGLAPYGEPTYAGVILDRLMDLKPDGTFRLNLAYFDYCTGLRMTSKVFHELFGGPPRRPDELLSIGGTKAVVISPRRVKLGCYPSGF